MDNKALRLFEYLTSYAWQHSKMPTHRQIAQALSISTKTIPEVFAVLNADDRYNLDELNELIGEEPRYNLGYDEKAEYPCYEQDEYGNVLFPGRSKELSHEWYSTNVLQRGKRSDDSGEYTIEMSTLDEVPVYQHVPDPLEALTQYRSMPGMGELSDRERESFILRSACIMDTKQIAKFCETSQEAIEVALRRADEKLAVYRG